VVVFHLWPHSLTGGFIGVDVFFVISGFLIGGHLLREAGEPPHGPVQFWGRRIRRLMPASLTTLFVIGLAVVIAVPQTLWHQFLSELCASALYVENWKLAADSVDYLAEGNASSPVQHFWTLSVEEQFYIVWPLVILGLAALWAALKRKDAVKPITIAVGAIAVASFVHAWHTSKQGSPAPFFFTTSRAWEFAAGTLLAIVVDSALRRGVAASTGLRVVASWVGWVMIFGSFFAFNATTRHPGIPTVVPVVGTLLVIAAGTVPHRAALTRVAGLRPVQYVGDISYSMYLWHWPVIILFPYIAGRTLAGPWFWVVIATFTALAIASYHLVERPVLDSKASWLRRPRALYPTLAGAMILTLALPVGALSWHARQIADFKAKTITAVTAPESCLGAIGAADPERCPDTAVAPLMPPPALSESDIPAFINTDECHMPDHLESGFWVCTYVGGTGEGGRVFLVGDSHARHYAAMVFALAEKYNWTVDVATRASCPFSEGVRWHSTPKIGRLCTAWNDAARKHILDTEPGLIITSQIQGREFLSDGYDSAHDAAVFGLVDAWQFAADNGARIIAIRDSPTEKGEANTCLEETWPQEPTACDRPRDTAFQEDYQIEAATHFPAGTVQLVDFSDLYCGDVDCHAAVHGVTVYQDARSHISATWATTLAPVLEDRLGDFLNLTTASAAQ
jgi:peptidoglycan/LPS O-acetylase OafA/YrhL